MIRIRTALLLAALASLVACQPAEEEPTPFLGGGGDNLNNTPGPRPGNNETPEEPEPSVEPVGQGDLRGYVATTDGRAMLGLEIRVTSAEGYDESTVTVDGGHFELLDVPFGEILIEIVPEDFAPVRRLLKHNEDSSATFFEFLLRRVTTGFFDSEVGGTVTGDGGASVTVPAGGYVHRDTGEALTGALVVRLAYFDPTEEEHIRAAPPLYRLLPEVDASRLVSLGMVDVELFIGDQPAQLGEDRTATINLDLTKVDGLLGGANAVPAWYYDTERGAWIQEGQGVVTRDKRWIAEVAHFTAWNADYTNNDSCDDEEVLNMRQCGSNVGACRPGLYRCLTSGNRLTLFDGQGGEASLCDGSVGPGAETCNGVDDDCDGSRDDSFPGKNDPCYTGPEETRGVGACRDGQTGCLGAGPALSGMLTCEAQTLPGTEACDGVDSDCDGVQDEVDANACGPNADCFNTDGVYGCVVRE